MKSFSCSNDGFGRCSARGGGDEATGRVGEWLACGACRGYTLVSRNRNFISHSFVEVNDIGSGYVDAKFETVWLLQCGGGRGVEINTCTLLMSLDFLISPCPFLEVLSFARTLAFISKD